MDLHQVFFFLPVAQNTYDSAKTKIHVPPPPSPNSKYTVDLPIIYQIPMGHTLQ